MSGPTLRLAAAGAATAAVWWLCEPLPWPARAFTAFLLGALPFLMGTQAELADEVPEDLSRPLLYRTSAAGLWALAIFALLAGDASGLSFATLGLRSPGMWAFALWSTGLTAVAVGALVLGRRLGIRERALLRFLLPRSPAEKLEFVGVAVTAGITEELVFRGFLISALVAAGASVLVSTALSCALFGYLHGYQGVAGTLRAGFLGLLLALPFLATGSVLPGMAAHAAVDLVGGIWLGERLMRE